MVDVQLIDKMFEYNLWANTQLIEVCSSLAGEQLDVEAVGIYGRIRPTIIHLLNAEGNYVRRLTGSHPWPADLDWATLSMAELKETAKLSGNRLVEIASKTDITVRHELDDGYTFFNWTVLLQALYHAIEHRTQIKVLLTQLGVEHPELAAWDYVDSLA